MKTEEKRFSDILKLLILKTEKQKLDWKQESIHAYYLLRKQNSKTFKIKIKFLPSLYKNLMDTVYSISVYTDNDMKFILKVGSDNSYYADLEKLYNLAYMKFDVSVSVSDIMDSFLKV